MLKRTHNCNDLRKEHVGQEVILMGWAQKRRDHGGVIFIDLRDRSGIAQVTASPETCSEEVFQAADSVRSEYVLAIKGNVRLRPEGMTTDKLELVTFQQALEAANTPSPDYDIGKWLYAPNFYSEYRYILGTRGKNPLICVGINPSTAKPDALDNTLKSVQRIAAGNGFDSFLMFNVYAQRATRPDDMEKQCNLRLHEENMKAFRHLLSIGEKPAVWAAWGAIIEKRKYLPDCVRDMLAAGEEFGASWYCAGAITKKGHPHHPLYLRKDEKIKPFDVKGYLEKLV